MGLLEIFNKKERKDLIKKYIENDAVVIDVRTEIEWNEGHIRGSEHIPLNTIPESINRIKGFQKPIIAVCKSGSRSQTATDFLLQQGLDVINGGSWQYVASIY